MFRDKQGFAAVVKCAGALAAEGEKRRLKVAPRLVGAVKRTEPASG